MKRLIYKTLRLMGILKKTTPKSVLESTIFHKGIMESPIRITQRNRPLSLSFERTPDGLGWMTQVKQGRTLLGRLPEADTQIIRKHLNCGHDLRVSIVDINKAGLPWERVRIKIESA